MNPSPSSDICVTLDDRVRLMSAALAATRYPEQAQARRPHGTHAHARATHRRMIDFADHDAIRSLQTLLDQGAPLEALFTLAFTLHLPDGRVEKPPRWMPPHWDEQLNRFYEDSGLANWWLADSVVWEKCLDDSQRVFEKVQLKAFLQPFLGEIEERLLFIPNISYPTDQELGLRIGGDLVCIVPPRLAWGDSPPWPFDEDPAHVYRAVLVQVGHMLMVAYLRRHAEQIAVISKTPLPVTDQFRTLYPTWVEQFANLFVAGAVAIYLEDHVSSAEANAYVLMERKLHGLEVLPGVINVFRHYLRELDAGHYTNLLDLLPNFSRRLKIANRIVTL